jgi:hypothetical protein
MIKIAKEGKKLTLIGRSIQQRKAFLKEELQ